MNIERLQRVKAQILAEPDRFDMEDYTTPIIDADRDRDGGICGTACCIAGFAAIDAGFIRLRTSPREGYAVYYDVLPPALSFIGSSMFAEALDLSPSEADRLFIVSHWPKKYAAEYEKASSHRERAEVGAKRIDHFIRTRGRE